MKRHLVLLSFFTLNLFFIKSCELNSPPEFHSVVPSDGYSVEQGEIVEFYFGASDPDGEVVSMSLEIDGTTVTTVSENFIDYDWDPGTMDAGQYTVTATAVDDLGKEAKTTIEIILDPVLVITPTDVRVAPYAGSIFVIWDVKVDYTGVGFADSFNVFWTDDGTEPDENKQMISGIPDEYFTHEDLDHTKTYKYKVQSVRKGFTSDLSSTASGSPNPGLLGIPQNLQVTLNGRNATLSWEAVEGSGLTYRVKRKCVPVDGYFKTVAEGLSGLSYADNDLPPGQGFFYKVNAHDPVAQRTSEDSETVYAVTKREVFENERNNEDAPTTLVYDTHYYSAEDITYNLDWFTIKGGYSGAYSIYSAASYRNFDADCFELYIEDGDKVEFKLIKGNMSDLWSMRVRVIEYGRTSSGNDREVQCHEFSGSSDSFVYQESTFGTVTGCYLNISMWEDLVNTGPYNYEVEIKIVRGE